MDTLPGKSATKRHSRSARLPPGSLSRLQRNRLLARTLLGTKCIATRSKDATSSSGLTTFFFSELFLDHFFQGRYLLASCYLAVSLLLVEDHFFIAFQFLNKFVSASKARNYFIAGGHRSVLNKLASMGLDLQFRLL